MNAPADFTDSVEDGRRVHSGADPASNRGARQALTPDIVMPDLIRHSPSLWNQEEEEVGPRIKSRVTITLVVRSRSCLAPPP